ncbi:Uncharacterized protein DBV15_01696 [Temnothorax longispinosus]|uniref:Uncharacterized protein n=1 Tax=Temnothorax longispinosus TaxID=300112 RepID=A0A4S2L0T0_9HYME|nr:Uncharacterized protein DBV15_01696 [Temnothorax longispinosus]
MAGSSEVTRMKCMDWFSPGRLPRNWHRQQVMDYRARPFREFPRHVRALKTLLVSLALMLLMLFDKLPSTYRLVNIIEFRPNSVGSRCVKRTGFTRQSRFNSAA